MIGPSRPRALTLLPLAEVSLAAVTLATVAGMWRLFEDGSYLWPLSVHAIAAHVLAAALRRAGVPTAASAGVVAVAAVLAVTWAHLPGTTTVGLPTGATLEAAGDRLHEAWLLFDEVRAPAPVLPGFLIAAGLAIWAAAFLADVAAFRLWTAFEPLVPTATIFVFASLFAADRARAGAAAMWLAAALAFTLAHRTARQHASSAWLGSEPQVGAAALLKTGAVLLVAAVAAGALLGPRLPGAEAAPVVAVRDLDDSGEARTTVSPLVEIKGRLVERSDVELFTVRTTQRSYWRLTALDEFDGEVWSSRGTFGKADGELDDAGDVPAGAVETVQSFAIGALDTIWLPAAFEPRAVDPGDAEVRWEPESSTLIVAEEQGSSAGLVYEVTSAVPGALSVESAASLTGPTPEEVLEANLPLPEDFPASVVALAHEIVEDAGAQTPYEQAIALQNFFRDGSFTYTLDAPPDHSGPAIEAFLFRTRAGYCEQFAGSYAAMARAVGLPTRVAVGFTAGEPVPGEPGVFVVRGEHAHAWPEVWIPGAGWLGFEPTPGRGPPNAPYTQVPEAQAASGDPTSATTAPTTASTPPQTAPAGGSATTVASPLPPELSEPQRLPQPEPGDGGSAMDALRLVAVLAGGVVAAAAAVAAGTAAGRAVRRWRRRAVARTPDARVQAAWADVVEAATVVGVVPSRHETPVEVASRVATAVDDLRPVRLAWLVERAEYARDGVDDEAASEAADLAADIRAGVRERTTRSARLLDAVDPRPPERRGPARAPRPAGPRLQITRPAPAAPARPRS